MSAPVLPAQFYNRPTLEVARDLLGCLLCRRLEDGAILRGRIVEVEAYTADDPASHSFRGRTARNYPMFGPPGRSYVYFIYGMYNCFNVVTEPEGTPGAVLVRGLDRLSSSNGRNEAANLLANGPGKLCRVFSIARELNDIDLTDPKGPLWLEKGPLSEADRVIACARIGINMAKDRQWRFYLLPSVGVSKRDRKAEQQIL